MPRLALLVCRNEYPRRTTLALSVYQLYYCGPRFTIIRAMPYDRPFTVWRRFRCVRPVTKNIATRSIVLPRPAGGLPGVWPTS